MHTSMGRLAMLPVGGRLELTSTHVDFKAPWSPAVSALLATLRSTGKSETFLISNTNNNSGSQT